MCRPFDSIRWMMLGLFWAAMARGAPASTDYNLPDEQSERAVDPGQMPTPPPCLLANEFAGLLRARGLPSVVVLTAPRDLPLWRTDTIPMVLRKQLDPTHRPSLAVGAQPGEFLVFQLGVVPVCTNLSGFGVEFSDLTGTRGILPGTALRCLTLGGIGPDGKSFHKTVSVPARTLQAVWIGVDVPSPAPDVYRGKFRLTPVGAEPIAIPLTITVAGDPVVEEGTADAWRLARLRWLDSRIGEEPTLPKGFAAVRVLGRAILIQGHRVVLGPAGLPDRIESTYSGSNTRSDAPTESLLAQPIRFVAETANGILPWSFGPGTDPNLQSPCTATWPIHAEARDLRLTGEGALSFYGHATMRLLLSARWKISLHDLRLEIPYAESAARYFMGLGRPGGGRPRRWPGAGT